MSNYWNYRILARKVSNEVQFGIYEVHYENDVPVACTQNPILPLQFASEGDPIESFNWQMDAFRRALEKPILNYDDFPNVYHKYYRKKKLESI
jgi:hypothetical protein